MVCPMGWSYDEFRQVGRDYTSAEEVAIYDETHARFRDVAVESQRVLDRLALDSEATLVDLGTGTGDFAIHAAGRAARVIGVDVSEPMLAYARKKAEKAGVQNLSFVHAGFLTYGHEGPLAEAITSSFAFHHLPDFWKGIALGRMRSYLAPGGQLFLRDVVLTADDPLTKIQAMIDRQAELGGDFLREDAEGHFREEFSTYDWVLRGLLERAGFTVVAEKSPDGVIAEYWCRV